MVRFKKKCLLRFRMHIHHVFWYGLSQCVIPSAAEFRPSYVSLSPCSSKSCPHEHNRIGLLLCFVMYSAEKQARWEVCCISHILEHLEALSPHSWGNRPHLPPPYLSFLMNLQEVLPLSDMHADTHGYAQDYGRNGQQSNLFIVPCNVCNYG